jgi:hypothetical protein
VTLTESTVFRNVAQGSGGGIYSFFGGKLTLNNSIVADNEAVVWGGGINADALEIRESTVSGNRAGYGAGVISGANETTPTLIISSTISGNSAVFEGGGISNWGTLVLLNSTVSGNSAEAAGGIFQEGVTALISSTIAANTAVIGSAVYDNTLGPVTQPFANSLIEGDCMGGQLTASASNNIESPGNTCGFDNHSVTAEQLNLGPLQDNGGPTMTHALGVGSVAIDQIRAVDCVDADGRPLTTDQRGEPRPETGGTMCDVGAFEVQP